MVRLNRLALSLLALLIVGCSKQAMTPQSAPIAPVSSLPPPAAEMPSLPEQLQFRHEELSEVPDAVQDWVDKLRMVPIGASLSHDDRTYLLVSAPDLCPEAASVSFQGVEQLNEKHSYRATAGFTCTTSGYAQPIALASVPATEALILFELKYLLLPHLYNPQDLPLPTLPPKGSGVFVEPAPGASVGDRIHVAGFAARLFEGTLNVRLVDPAGKVVAETHGQGAGGMGTSWGSFIVDLDASEAPSGSYWLELGDYSMRDGSWQLKERMKVIKE